jgi:hypothetical protein
MNPLIQLKTTPLLFIAFVLACLALSPRAEALLPAPSPDGNYPGGNTAEGINALHDVNTAVGINNTAVGLNALTHDTTGQYNVALGYRALENNITGDFNMTIGTEALTNNNASFNLAIGFRVGFMNTTGRHLTGIGAAALRNNTTASFNTAIGADAMRENTIGEQNTAIGAEALSNNDQGGNNTATGFQALLNNVDGSSNTAIGLSALFSNTTGHSNTATGVSALVSNITGDQNTANGRAALYFNTIGHSNTANGVGALQSNSTGSDNTAIGRSAGFNITGSGNVCIGEGVFGVAGVDDRIYIRNINTTVQSFSAGVNDYVTVRLTDGRLGHTQVVSSRRYKEDIKSLDKTSEALFALKPVSFRLKKEYDEAQALGFGLIAEEVEKVEPALVYRNKKGQVESVRYKMVNAMLLNEFLKEHRKVEKQETTISQLKQDFQSKLAE